MRVDALGAPPQLGRRPQGRQSARQLGIQTDRNMGNNYRAHERAGVKIERQCGLTPLERRPNLEGGRKADRAPDSWEYKQAERTGLNPRAIKAEVKELREASSS